MTWDQSDLRDDENHDACVGYVACDVYLIHMRIRVREILTTGYDLAMRRSHDVREEKETNER